MISRMSDPKSGWRRSAPEVTAQKDARATETTARTLPAPEEEPFGVVPSVLVVSQDDGTGQLLGDTLRRRLKLPGAPGSGIAEVHTSSQWREYPPAVGQLMLQ